MVPNIQYKLLLYFSWQNVSNTVLDIVKTLEILVAPVLH